MKEDTKNAVTLAHSRTSIKDLMYSQPKFGSMKTFGTRADTQKVLGRKDGGRRDSSVFVVEIVFVFCGQYNISDKSLS